MENDKIKQMLLDIRESNLDFTVVQSGKESKRVNGLYKPDTHEIILHNKNFKQESQLVYTAIHEYAHHLIAEEQLALNGSSYIPNAKCHTQAFWALFHELLKIAETKGYYKLDLSISPELQKLTDDIKKNYLEKNGLLMMEFGKALLQAQHLCEESNIRYEDYVDRILCLPRVSARDITRVGSVNVNPAVGFDNMKMISTIKKTDDRQAAEQQILSGESPVTVRSLMKQKAKPVDDKKTKLEKEKNRLAKTISQLQQRLEFVEESLATL
jgi:hypothetical protein